MTEQRDDFYQPWVREPAAPTPVPGPAKRRYEPLPPAEGIPRDDAMPPLGVDLSGYAVPETPPPVAARAKPIAAAAAAGTARAWTATRRSAAAFAAWTIALGARADVPRRVAALEIPRRAGAVTRRAGALLAAAGRATAQSAAGVGRAAQRAMGSAAQQSAAGLRKAAAQGKIAAEQGKAAAGERLAALRPPPPPVAEPPASGLDRLLQTEADASRRGADNSNLPLFRAPAIAAAAPAEATPPPLVFTADERPPSEPPGSGPGGHGVGAADTAAATLPRWVPWGAAALLVLALTFWLGARWGGGGMDRASVETLVKETILANPEIVPQALERHQANQMATAIDAVRPVLEKPFSGAWAGNAKGDVTVTVFTDYGCVFCRASIADIDRLVRADKGVKLVYRELPIIAPQSKDAAIAALAAARQGKYDAFHHAMFAAPGLDRAAIDAASTRAGVIIDGRSDAGVDTRLFEREIDNNLALAQQLGINATPTWIIGSRMLQGAVGYAELKQAVDAARAAN